MKKGTALATALLALPLCLPAQETSTPARPAAPAQAGPPRADTTQAPPTRITLDEAIRLALQHNHALLAARSTILLACVSGVYYWRARTEERHLMLDPAYRDYHAWMTRNGAVPRLFAWALGHKRLAVPVPPAA